MHVYVLVQVDRPVSTQRSEGIGPPGTRVTGVHQMPGLLCGCGCWDGNPGAHVVRLALFTAEPPLRARA